MKVSNNRGDKTMKKYGVVLLVLFILFGTSAVAEESNLTNVALNKTVTAGNYSNTNPKSNLVDGKSDTYVDEKGGLTDNESGTPSNYENGDNWYQIDLEKSYYLDHIILYDDTAFWGSCYNIRILVSDTPDFSEKTVLLESAEWEEMTFPISVQSDGEAYRYVRLEKISTSMNFEYCYTELEVWANESEAEEEPEIILENAALGKPVSAGCYIDETTKDDINDGDENTGVFSVNGKNTDNPDGVMSKVEDDWYQIDMGEPYLVDHIILKRDRENWMTALCFQIMVSNSPDFSDGTAVVLFEVGESGAASFPLRVSGDGNYYRYVRLQRTGMTSYERYTELEVWSPGALRTEVSAVATGNNTALLRFDREMDFSVADSIKITDFRSGKEVSYTVSVQDDKNLQIDFAEEMNGKTISLKLPSEFESQDGVALKNTELQIIFSPVITVENFIFTDENESAITQLGTTAKLGFSADVVNHTQDLNGGCVFILAFYRGDDMVYISDIRVNTTGGETKPAKLETDISQLDADNAAVFIWNNYTEALTVTQTYTISK